MSIKKSQALLKCFIDLKCSVCLALGSETKPCFVTLKNPKRSERIDADELSKALSTGNEILDNRM